VKTVNGCDTLMWASSFAASFPWLSKEARIKREEAERKGKIVISVFLPHCPMVETLRR